MSTTAEKIQEMTFDAFFSSSKMMQREFINSIKLVELAGNKPLLKKFIAMKVLTEARHAAEDKSLFNLTAQFRNFLALFLPALALGADHGPDPEGQSNTGRGIRGEYAVEVFGMPDVRQGEDRVDEASNGYRLFHISEMGHYSWERRFFNLGVNKENEMVTKTISTKMEIGINQLFGYSVGPFTYHSPLTTWDQLDNPTQLRGLFAKIKEETQYKNTLGYDLYCVAAYGIAILLELSANTSLFALVLVPFALMISLAIYAVVIPISLTLSAVEHLVINPLKWLSDHFVADEHEAFIEEVGQLSMSF